MRSLSPHSLLLGEHSLRWFWVVAVATSLVGCARGPGGGDSTGTRLTFSMTVEGKINPNFVYIVALRPSTSTNPPEDGPLPVIRQPWGNGFVAGDCDYFVQFSPDFSPNYAVFKFRDRTLNEWFQIGVPVRYDDVPADGKTIKFDLNLSQIAGNVNDADLLQTLQINFLTMDRVPRGNDTRGKSFDALGNSRLPSEVNSPITISLKSSRVYDNRSFNQLEPLNDVADPDLDLRDFRVEVQLP